MRSHSKQPADVPGHIQQREQILLEQLPLVRHIARQIHYKLPKHVVLDDLVQAGIIGLIDAVQKYDSHKHVQFGTYAKIRIRGAILDSLRELDWGPRSLRKMGRRAEEARSSLRTALGREPSETEVAQGLGMRLSGFQSLRQDLDRLTVLNFHPCCSDEDKAQDFTDYPGPSDQSPYCVRLRVEVTVLLRTLISQLPSRQRKVLDLYYRQDLTMKEIGAALGITESRISQLHTLAVNGLRSRLEDMTQCTSSVPLDSACRLLQP